VDRSASFALLAGGAPRHDAGCHVADTVLSPLPAADGFSTLTTTVIFSAYAAGVLAALVLFGQISDAIGRRRTLLPGLACTLLVLQFAATVSGLGRT